VKISDIQVVPVQAPGRTLVIILVSTDAGLTGVGEAGLQRRWRAIEGAVQHLRRWLIGEEAERIEYLWQRMFRGGFYPADRVIGSAISGIDIALWDIKGQALGVPIYQLLGGRCRDYVDIFSGAGSQVGLSQPVSEELLEQVTQVGDAQAALELARLYQASGHRFFRLNPPGSRAGAAFEPRVAARRLIEQLRAVRSGLGDQLELMVDLHTRLNPPDAIWFCREVEELGMFAIEDPIRSEHPTSYRTIRQHINTPLAAGEQWANKWEFAPAIEEELVDFVRPDICVAGGLSEVKKIAALAEAHHIQLLLHNPLGPVCTAASLHIDLACANAGPQEVLFPPTTILPDVFECSFELQGNRLTPPEAPGLGVKFNPEAARAYPAEMTEPPHLHRPDGAFTNW